MWMMGMLILKLRELILQEFMVIIVGSMVIHIQVLPVSIVIEILLCISLTVDESLVFLLHIVGKLRTCNFDWCWNINVLFILCLLKQLPVFVRLHRNCKYG